MAIGKAQENISETMTAEPAIAFWTDLIGTPSEHVCVELTSLSTRYGADEVIDWLKIVYANGFSDADKAIERISKALELDYKYNQSESVANKNCRLKSLLKRFKSKGGVQCQKHTAFAKPPSISIKLGS